MPNPPNPLATTCARYHAWTSALARAKELRDAYQESGSAEVKSEFDKVLGEAEKAYSDYEAAKNEAVVYEGKEIITKDVLFLAYMQKKVGVDKYEVDCGRINVFTAKNKDLSNLGTIYFPDGFRSLFLNEAAINNPELLKFPDGLQILHLNEATINNPELLKFPDDLQGLHLTKATINNPELLKFPDGLRVLLLNKAAVNNPELLRFPDGLRSLFLTKAAINNPELLKFPDGLLYLYLKGVKLTDAAREMLRE